MRVLIYGASGKVGYSIYKYFQGRIDHDVIGVHFSNKTLDSDLLDFPDSGLMKNFHKRFDIIILAMNPNSSGHFGTIKKYSDLYVKNCFDIIKTIHSTQKKVVLLSSCVLYPEGNDISDEDTLTVSAECEGEYKDTAAALMTVESELRKKCLSISVPFLITRIASVYGVSKSGVVIDGVIPDLLKKFLRNSEIINFIKGSEDTGRNFIHIDDVVHMLFLMSLSPNHRSGIYNICANTNTTLHDLAACIGELTSNTEYYFKSGIISSKRLIKSKYNSIKNVKKITLRQGVANMKSIIEREINANL